MNRGGKPGDSSFPIEGVADGKGVGLSRRVKCKLVIKGFGGASPLSPMVKHAVEDTIRRGGFDVFTDQALEAIAWRLIDNAKFQRKLEYGRQNHDRRSAIFLIPYFIHSRTHRTTLARARVFVSCRVHFRPGIVEVRIRYRSRCGACVCDRIFWRVRRARERRLKTTSASPSSTASTARGASAGRRLFSLE
jgi:hypothetical protein